MAIYIHSKIYVHIKLWYSIYTFEHILLSLSQMHYVSIYQFCVVCYLKHKDQVCVQRCIFNILKY